jgi:tRNA G37 N-methylase TrmD
MGLKENQLKIEGEFLPEPATTEVPQRLRRGDRAKPKPSATRTSSRMTRRFRPDLSFASTSTASRRTATPKAY